MCRHLLEWTVVYHGTLKDSQSTSWMRFEAGRSQIRKKSANHSASMSDKTASRSDAVRIRNTIKFECVYKRATKSYVSYSRHACIHRLYTHMNTGTIGSHIQAQTYTALRVEISHRQNWFSGQVGQRRMTHKFKLPSTCEETRNINTLVVTKKYPWTSLC
jgi:hypothetical protein